MSVMKKQAEEVLKNSVEPFFGRLGNHELAVPAEYLEAVEFPLAPEMKAKLSAWKKNPTQRVQGKKRMILVGSPQVAVKVYMLAEHLGLKADEATSEGNDEPSK